VETSDLNGLHSFQEICTGTHWKLQFYQLFSPMERPKAKEKFENGKETR